ncbi:MAG: DUF3795 domain-containing protein [Bacilli bacterium]
MNKFIACCGLDCEKCQARIATINNDNNLREQVSNLWTKMNGVEITSDMINCEGCRQDGCKTPFCEKLCEIRQCVLNKNIETCGDCENLHSCSKIKMIISNNKEALARLENKEY